ncbi:hypothetical protein K440DRAFT_664576 [Wilcoxina mikolae CBS 423.85]|nr:hypothetical protein K440DRAFT_664576 [Wilcoxina mikolae CBS 423.85]
MRATPTKFVLPIVGQILTPPHHNKTLPPDIPDHTGSPHRTSSPIGSDTSIRNSSGSDTTCGGPSCRDASCTFEPLALPQVESIYKRFKQLAESTLLRKAEDESDAAENHFHDDRFTIKILYEVYKSFVNNKFEELKKAKVQYYDGCLHISNMAPLPYHDIGPGILKENTELLVQLGVITLQKSHLLGFGNQTYLFQRTGEMIPDGQVLVNNHCEGVWPTIVFEVANSESYERVIGKMARWFNESQGTIRAVLVIKYENDALDDSTVFTEVWRCLTRTNDTAVAITDPGVNHRDPPIGSNVRIEGVNRKKNQLLQNAKRGQRVFVYREGPRYVPMHVFFMYIRFRSHRNRDRTMTAPAISPRFLYRILIGSGLILSTARDRPTQL